ncbi:acyltransferase family protein [Streptomyces sp. URMC 123]|uniref:acyltransferase family protein n=1 Tax=Streptomyces sp. URMC 123 TaxID=3423403 RepID=UPI003F19E0BA
MAPTVPRSPASRLPSLTGLRFVAAFAVFASHAYFVAWFDGDFAAPATRLALIAAWSGVGFFFLLSGFVLAWSARPADTAVSFWRRRVAKIYPTHAVTWFAALVLIVWTGGQITARQAVPNLFLLHAWSPSLDVYNSVNGVSWSLSCEALFYLSFPLLIHLVRRIPAHRLWHWAGGTALAVILLPLLVTLAFPGEPKFAGLPVTLHQYWFLYVFPVARLLEFALGMLLARAVLEGRRVAVRYWHAAVALAIGYPLALKMPFLYGIAAVLVVPMSLLILAGANADVRGGYSLARHRAMVWLGEVSFAFYMVHMLVLENGYRLIDEGRTASPAARTAAVAGLFAAALLASWALYAGVERPVMRRWGGAGRGSGRTAPARSGPVTPVPTAPAPPAPRSPLMSPTAGDPFVPPTPAPTREPAPAPAPRAVDGDPVAP